MSILANAAAAQPTLEDLGLLAAAASVPAIIGAAAIVVMLRRAKPVPYAPPVFGGKVEVGATKDGKVEGDKTPDFFQSTSFGLIEFVAAIAIFFVMLLALSSVLFGQAGAPAGDANVSTTNESELAYGATTQPEAFELEPGEQVVRQLALGSRSAVVLDLRDIEPPVAADTLTLRLVDSPLDEEPIALASGSEALRGSDISPGVYYILITDTRAAQTQPAHPTEPAAVTFELHANVIGTQGLAFNLLAESILKLLAIGIAAWLCVARCRQNPLAILYRAPRIPELARGALILLAAAPILYVELPVLIQVVYALNNQIAPLQPIVETLRDTRDPMLWGCAIFSVVIVAPIVEEFVFRGLLYTGIRRGTNPIIAIVVSAGLFGLVHGVWSAIVVTALLGALLAIVYERTRSLVAPTIMHALFNAGSLVGLILA